MIILIVVIGFIFVYIKLISISKKIDKVDCQVEFLKSKLALVQMEIEDLSLTQEERIGEDRLKMKRKFLEYSNEEILKFKDFY